MRCIEYKKGYKYQLVTEYSVYIPVIPDNNINSTSGYIDLSRDGQIFIKKGYAWDGPSGPTVDTLNFMRGSLVHDALYQLMREGLLDYSIFRKPADKLLKAMCKEDGMSAIRAWWIYRGLRYAGDPSANPDNRRPVIKAPKSC